MFVKTTIPHDWNLKMHSIDRHGRRRLLFRDHNIFLNVGREYVTQRISAGAPSTTVAYVGFGIGGARQTDADADVAPLSVDYPGSNTQLDTDLLVTEIERPVLLTAGVWLRAVNAPSFIGPTVSDPARVAYTANFDTDDFTLVGGYSKVPLSEVMLYLSSADPAQANGGAGTHGIAYKTFSPIPKTAINLELTWELRV